MTGTFRLTRAEFKKIFKRPSVFIMALILVATIFVSLYVFNPASSKSVEVDYNLETAQAYYNTFYSADLSDSEKGIINKISSTNEIITYHTQNSLRKDSLYLYYSEILKSYNNLKNAKYESKDEAYSIFKNSLTDFIGAFDASFDNFKDYKHITITRSNSQYLASIDNFRKISNQAASTDCDSMINIIEINKYLETFENEYNNVINYSKPVLVGIASTFKANFNTFQKNINNNHSILEASEENRKTLLNNIKDFHDYYNLIVNSDFPIATVSDQTHKELVDALELTTRNLNIITTQGKASDYATILTELENSNIYNYLSHIAESDEIKLVNISSNLVKDYDKVNQILERNITKIKEKIEEHKNDEGIKNIKFHMTEYLLLSDCYNQYVNDLLINDMAENFTEYDFNKLNSDNCKEYNKYQYNERISANKHYLDSNTYSNSYITNFTFNHNSSNKTNAFDFMYFALELCSIVITIFAMLQICNLITNETESGTITLLLVRPYKRGKIITAKLLTTIFFVFTFMLFSVILTFAGGFALFGIENTPILAVFNSSKTMVISPILLMLINIATLLIDIIFFVIIALMIAVMFKNFAASITSSFIIIIVTYVLNLLFGKTYWYSFLPGSNLHLFKFFGNNFINSGSISMIAEIFATPIQNSMSILFSGILITAYAVISLIISYSIFKHRDF